MKAANKSQNQWFSNKVPVGMSACLQYSLGTYLPSYSIFWAISRHKAAGRRLMLLLGRDRVGGLMIPDCRRWLLQPCSTAEMSTVE